METTGRIHVDVDGGIATITFDHPPVNAWNRPMTDGLRAALDDLRADAAVRVLILTGAGDRAFCAGSDILEFSSLMGPGQAVEHKLRPQHEVFRALAEFPKPTIAAINGLALGGGVEIAVCCDLVIAEEHVKLGCPEIKLGVFPSSGGTFRVARRIGEGRAKQLQLLGEPVDAQTALQWGLVSQVVPRGEALAAARETAATLASRPPLALSLCKAVINAAGDLSEDEIIEFSLASSDRAFTSAEAREGVSAFLGKRTPDFSGFGAGEADRA